MHGYAAIVVSVYFVHVRYTFVRVLIRYNAAQFVDMELERRNLKMNLKSQKSLQIWLKFEIIYLL